MPPLPSIDIIIIGLNSVKTLESCIRSAQECRYPQDLLSIVYADGGSTDESQSIAETLGCTCVQVESDTPTPGRQRNAGWQAGSATYVQFLDSDTILDPEWLHKSISVITREGIGAVCGNRKEMHPEETLFNWLGDQEWNGRPGEVEAFGGDVLVRRAALDTTGGYDPELVAGEDPELSYQICRAGFKILRLDEPMTRHDLAMRTIKQYWKRAHRSGHAYAELHARHRDFRALEVRRIAIRAAAFWIGIAALPLGLVSPWFLMAFPAGLALLLRPRLLVVAKFQKDLSLTVPEARIYAWHASLVVLPQFAGMLRFHYGRLFSRPLRNKRVILGKKENTAK